MAGNYIVSDGAGSSLDPHRPLSPDEQEQLKRILGLAPPFTSAKMTRDPGLDAAPGPNDPALEPIPTKPYVNMDLRRPQQSQQLSEREKLMQQLDEVAHGQSFVGDDPSAMLNEYGLDSHEFMHGVPKLGVEPYTPPAALGQLSPDEEAQLRQMADDKLREGGLDPEAFRRGQIRKLPAAPQDVAPNVFDYNPSSEQQKQPSQKQLPVQAAATALVS